MSLDREKIEEVMEEEIRPHLKADGGDAEIVDVEDGVVTVQLKGACVGCPMSQLTIQGMIEEQLKNRFPEVEKVETAEDDQEQQKSTGFF